MIRSALDYIPMSNSAFLGSIVDSFNPYRPEAFIKYKNKESILGYSCRSLFDTIMNYYKSKNENLKILTTPIHHTSFRNIIEKYVDPNNIFILDMNESFNEITALPKCLKNNQIDLCIISHMFGQDLKMDIIKDFKINNPNCIIIEDRVQGGYFFKEFSHDFINIALYSTGMDKKPCALGGGFVYIKNDFYQNEELKIYVKNKINNYPQQYFYHRIINLINKIPTFLIYNSKLILCGLFNIFNYFKIDINNFAVKYRKNYPGFFHNDYNKNPSNGTLTSIYKSLKRVSDIEYQYYTVSNKFFNALDTNTKKKFFPWVKNNYLLTPYNTISVENTDDFCNFLKKNNIVSIKNPTWKMFNFEYKNSDYHETFNNSLVYIPSLPIMNDSEINFLANKIKEYYKIKFDYS